MTQLPFIPSSADLLKEIPESLKQNTLRFLKDEIPHLDLEHIHPQHIEPVLSVWHKLLRLQKESGLTTKASALLLLSLKTTLNTEWLTEKETQAIHMLLDMLGMLTVELLSAEQEHVIDRQNETIQFLQNPTLNNSLLIGESEAMQQVLDALTPTLPHDVTVLLQGESGTGKDVIATLIHKNSPQKNKPFIAINCGAIPKDLIEVELFGAEKGAFTGADQRRLGLFELAQEGTVFLDEIGDLTLDLQVKLLRVLQNKEIQRLGGQSPIPINVRILAATHKDLKQAVDQGTFRLDLYYRICVFPIDIPPLRDRKADIRPLALYFTQQYCKQFGLAPKHLTPGALSYLESLSWPGNVRELENTIQRAILMAPGSSITEAILLAKPGKKWNPDTPPALLPHPDLASAEPPVFLSFAESEKKIIQNALDHFGWNIKKTAEALELSRTTLYAKMKQYRLIKNV